MVTLPEAIPEPLPDAEGISQYNMEGGLFRDRGMGLLMLRSGAGVRRTRQKDEGQMRETIRKKVMAEQQKYGAGESSGKRCGTNYKFKIH